MSNVNKVKLLLERTSGVTLVIFISWLPPPLGLLDIYLIPYPSDISDANDNISSDISAF